MFAAEARGEILKGTAARWQKKTEDKLPEKVKTAAYESGVVIGMARAITELSDAAKAKNDTNVLSIKELMAIKDPAERKRYLADMSARNQQTGMDPGNSTRAAVATQKS
jgi:lysozyme family protein